MPPHDYLIYGDPDEINKLDKSLTDLKQALNQVNEMIMTYDGGHLDEVKTPLEITSDGIVKIENLAKEIIYIPDPLGLGYGCDAPTGFPGRSVVWISECRDRIGHSGGAECHLPDWGALSPGVHGAPGDS